MTLLVPSARSVNPDQRDPSGDPSDLGLYICIKNEKWGQKSLKSENKINYCSNIHIILKVWTKLYGWMG